MFKFFDFIILKFNLYLYIKYQYIEHFIIYQMIYKFSKSNLLNVKILATNSKIFPKIFLTFLPFYKYIIFKLILEEI